MINWIIGVVFIYSLLFGIGKFILGFTDIGMLYLFIAIISGCIMYLNLPREEKDI